VFGCFGEDGGAADLCALGLDLAVGEEISDASPPLDDGGEAGGFVALAALVAPACSEVTPLSRAEVPRMRAPMEARAPLTQAQSGGRALWATGAAASRMPPRVVFQDDFFMVSLACL